MVKKYRVSIASRTNGELIEVLDMERVHFTRREYKLAMLSLFYWAASGIEFEKLRATVSCDGAEVLIIDCETTVDGSCIWCEMMINSVIIRHAVIAC